MYARQGIWKHGQGFGPYPWFVYFFPAYAVGIATAYYRPKHATGKVVCLGDILLYLNLLILAHML